MSAYADIKNPKAGVVCTVRELFFEGQKSRGDELHLRRAARMIRGGAKRSSLRGRGMEFFESRPYVNVDEMRTIDWKVSARFGGLFTKVFIEEKDRPIYFAVDLRRSMYFGSVNCFKSVLAARVTARLLFAAMQGGDRILGSVFSTEVKDIKSGHGEIALARFLSALASGTENLSVDQKTNNFTSSFMLKRIAERVPKGAQVFLISDFFRFEDTRPWLYKIVKSADLFAIHICDPLEEKIPGIGPVAMEFDEEFVRFNSSDEKLQQQYIRFRQAAQKKLRDTLVSLNIPYLQFSTADDPKVGLRRIFSGRW